MAGHPNYMNNHGVDRVIRVQSIGIAGPRGVCPIPRLSELEDVDVTFLRDRSVLSYNAATGKWVASTTVYPDFDLDGGIYFY
jgi:hypothetical protein